jgi:transglutaminase-like putative cysteine protease
MDMASGDPQTSYDVFGSNEFTRYIAGHMLNGAGSIDVSSFLDDPSQPSLDEAAQEAVKQNPMLSLAVETYLPEDDRLYVVYREDHETTEAVRSEILDIAESVVGEITTADMGDAEKATAINQWIVDNIEYDYEALDALQASGGYAPPGHEMREWDTRGALLDKMVVCGGYADAFNLLAREAGLESVYVSGDVSSGAHAWNHVKIDGEWKAIDTTWNDNGVDPTLYLLIDESDFTGDAQRTLAESGWIASIHQDEYATP